MWSAVRDAVTILVGGNVGEVIVHHPGHRLGHRPGTVGTRQLLLVNLLTDMFPALAVAVTPQIRNQRRTPTRPKKRPKPPGASTNARCCPSRRRRSMRH